MAFPNRVKNCKFYLVLGTAGLTLLGRVTPIGIDVPTHVARIEDLVKVLAVVRARRVGLVLADALVLLVDVDRELVVEVALAVLLGPARIDILLAPICRLPVGRHRPLVNQLLLATTVVPLGGRHQGRVDDLVTAHDEALLELLRRDAIEEGLRAGFTDPILEGPHRRAVRDIGVRLAAEALVAHPVEQLVLHLFVGQVVQALQHQDPHHRLGRVRRTSALRTHRARRNLSHLGRQRRKVDVRLDVGQRIAQRVDVLTGTSNNPRISVNPAA